MAKDLSDAATDDLDDNFDDDTESTVFGRVAFGGQDLSIRRKIEERLERKRLLEELGLDEMELDF